MESLKRMLCFTKLWSEQLVLLERRSSLPLGGRLARVVIESSKLEVVCAALRRSTLHRNSRSVREMVPSAPLFAMRRADNDSREK